MTTTRFLFLLLCSMLLAGCQAAPVETTSAVLGGTTAVASYLTDMFGMLKPFLKPEQVAMLSEKLANAQSWAEVVTQGVGAVANGIADLRAATDANTAKAAEGITMADAVTITGVGVATDRALSFGQRAHRRAKAAKNGG